MSSTTIKSPIGPLTISMSENAVTSLSWDEIPPASETNNAAKQAADELVQYLKGTLKKFSVAFAPKGTEFQQTVWRAMQKIPYGKTVTYGELAKKLGTAPRAIARACASNPIPLFIPCHRVVGQNGSLTGYSGRGGIETKQWLLDLEQK